jgi:hypothetical protein
MARKLTTAGMAALLGLLSLIPALWVYRVTAGAAGMHAGLRLITFEFADTAGLFRFFVGITCGVGVFFGLGLSLEKGVVLFSNLLVHIGVLEQREKPTTTQPATARTPTSTRTTTKLLTALLIVAVPLALIYGVVFLWSAVPWGNVENWIDARTANDPGVIGRNVAILFWGGVGVVVVLLCVGFLICGVIAAVTAILKGPGRR